MADPMQALYDQLDNPNSPHRYARWIPQPNINLPADRRVLQVGGYPPARMRNPNAAPRPRRKSAGLAGDLIHAFSDARRDVGKPVNKSNCEFRYLKTLGCGGQGLAALYEYTPRLDHPHEVQHIVIKYFFPHERQIARYGKAQAVTRAKETAKKEVGFAMGFLRAAHVTQLAKIIQMPPRAIPFFNLPDGCATALEYYARGDVHGALRKFAQYYWVTLTNEQRIALPKKFYWNIFKCLWMMHVAMAYPPRSLADDQDAFWASDEPIKEEFPGFFDPSERRQPRRFVHFDLDPQNILVGDFDADRGSDHYSVPNLKLSDFGCMQEVTRTKLRDVTYMHSLRRVGKTMYLAPEQFTTEWDLPFWDQRQPPQDWPAEVAGKFSNKTNLFQLGLVMYNFLTLTTVGAGDPRPQPIPYPHHPQHPIEGGQQRGRTYASVLLYDDQAGHIEPYLRDLVIRMLYEDADRRPGFLEIESILRFTQPWARGDDESRELSLRIFDQPLQSVPDGPKSRLLSYLEHGGALQAGMGPTEMIPWFEQNFPAQGNVVPVAAPAPVAQPTHGAARIVAPSGGLQPPLPPFTGGLARVPGVQTLLPNVPPPAAGLATPAGFARPGMQAAQAAQAAGAGQGIGGQLTQRWNQQAATTVAMAAAANASQAQRALRGQTPGPGAGGGRGAPGPGPRGGSGASGGAQVLAPHQAGLQNRYPRRAPPPGVTHLIGQVGGHPGPAAQQVAGRGAAPARPVPPGMASFVVNPLANLALQAAQQAAQGVQGPGIIGPAAMTAPGGPAAPQGPALPQILMGPLGPVAQHMLRRQQARYNLRGQTPGPDAGNAGGAGAGAGGEGGEGGAGGGGGARAAAAAKATIINASSSSRRRRRARKSKARHLARMVRRTVGPFAMVSDVDENGEEIPIPPTRATPSPPPTLSQQLLQVRLPSPPQTISQQVRQARLPSPPPPPPPREFVPLFPTDTYTRPPPPPLPPHLNKPVPRLPTPLPTIFTSSRDYYPPSSSRTRRPRQQQPYTPLGERQYSPPPWYQQGPSPRPHPQGARQHPPSVPQPIRGPAPPDPRPNSPPSTYPTRPRPQGPRRQPYIPPAIPGPIPLDQRPYSPPPAYPQTPPLPPSYSPTRLPDYSAAPQAGHNLPPSYPNREEIVAYLQYQAAERARRQIQRSRAEQERARRAAELEGARAREARAAQRRRRSRGQSGIGARLRRFMFGYREEDEEVEDMDVDGDDDDV